MRVWVCAHCGAYVLGYVYDQSGHSYGCAELVYTYNPVPPTCFQEMHCVDRPDILAAYLIGGLAAVVEMLK